MAFGHKIKEAKIKIYRHILRPLKLKIKLIYWRTCSFFRKRKCKDCGKRFDYLYLNMWHQCEECFQKEISMWEEC